MTIFARAIVAAWRFPQHRVLPSQAQSIPGAREFVFIARRFGFRVVFITNRACRPESGFDERGRSRDCPQKAATLDNLANALGHRPAHVDLHMRLEMSGRDDSDKKARRETGRVAAYG